MHGLGPASITSPCIVLFLLLTDSLFKETFDTIIDFTKIFITASKLDRVFIDSQVSIPVDYLSIIDLIGVVSFSEDILHHRASVDDALAHPVVLEGDQILVFVVKIGRVKVVEGVV